MDFTAMVTVMLASLAVITGHSFCRLNTNTHFQLACHMCACNNSDQFLLLDMYCINVTFQMPVKFNMMHMVHKLVICHSNIHTTVLKRSDTLYLLSLKHLEIINNNVFSVETDAFASLHTLEYLDLSDNHIENLSVDFVTRNTFLHSLILSGNDISLPTKGPFLSIPSLLHLDLSRCGITVIPTLAFQKMVSIVTLKLNNNSIEFIFGNEFVDLKCLSELHLDYNRIKSINKITFQLNNKLKKLSLTGNKFLALQSDNLNFLTIPSLQVLWLDDCGMNTLPSPSNVNLRNLIKLSVNHNNLKAIDFNFLQKLTQLKEVSVLSNSLKCGCLGQSKKACCTQSQVQVLATCKEGSWDIAQNVTCSRQIEDEDGATVRKWMTMAVIAGALVFFLFHVTLTVIKRHEIFICHKQTS